MKNCVFVFLFLSFLHIVQPDNPCAARAYTSTSNVCVCDSSYCDTIDHIDHPPKHGYIMISTNKEGLRFHKTEGSLNVKNDRDVDSATFNINQGIEYQEILGFGTSFTDAAGINLHTLSEDVQDKLLDSWFSAQGNEINTARVPIAGCDFSTRPYSYDDVPGDVELEHFALVEEDLVHKIPVIHKAITRRENVGDGDTVKLLASPWAPPAWMKTNNKTNDGGWLIRKYQDVWAQYFIRFLEEYKKHDLSFWALTVQNEPISPILVPDYPWNCMAWLPWSEGTFVRDYLGPQLQNSPFASTLLFSMDDQRFSLPLWKKGLFQDASKASFYQGVAFHWYGDKFINADVISRFHKDHPEYLLLYTEACVLNPPTLGFWFAAQDYAHDILENLNHYVGGWIDWNFALDLEGGPNWAEKYFDTSIIVNATGNEFYKQPSFYALGHFSKFLPKGSKRVEILADETSIEYGAFITPQGHTVGIFLNFEDDETVMTVQDNSVTFTVTLTPNSINTILW